MTANQRESNGTWYLSSKRRLAYCLPQSTIWTLTGQIQIGTRTLIDIKITTYYTELQETTSKILPLKA